MGTPLSPPWTRRARNACAAAAALLLIATSTGCATTGAAGDGSSTDDTCGAIILAVIAVPCAIAWGTGCVVGGCTACVEHQSEGARRDAPAPAPSEVAPAEPDEEAQSVAY